MSDPVVCKICGFAKESTAKEQTQAVKSQEDESTEALTGGFNRAYHKADAAIVFVLGYKTKDGGVKTRQIDVFSAMNGYHIRSMPDRRYRNPVMVGGGDNFIAVVDRFQDTDVIRITDKYFGLTEDDFDDYGLPREEIDLDKVDDLLQVTTPQGSRVTGLTILPRGILIANITKEDGIPRYIKVDVRTTLGQDTQPGFNGIDTLTDPFYSWGNMIGAPAPYDIALGSSMLLFATIISDGQDKHGVAIVDLTLGEVIAYVGLPSKYTPLQVSHGQGVIHVLVKDEDAPVSDNETDPTFGNKVLRIPVIYGNYMLSGGLENDAMILEPQDYQVSKTYQVKDAASEQDTDLPAYIEGARQLNSNYDVDAIGDKVTAEDISVTAPSGLSEGQNTASSTELASRPQTTDSDAASNTYDDSRNIPVKVITLPDDRRIFAIGTVGNTLVEGGYAWDEANTEDPRDTSKPLFFVFHNSHYDYLSDGGFIYGCVKEVNKTDASGNVINGSDGEPETEYKSVVVTNDFTPIAMGFDNQAVPGVLRTLPDMGVVLVDAKTNRPMYRHPKNLGVKVYAGSYASAQYTDENKVIRSVCSDEADSLATTLDGITRPITPPAARKPERDPTPHEIPGYDPDYYPVEAYGNAHEYDMPFEVLSRSVVPGSDKALVQLAHSSWSMREDNIAAITPALLPEWRDGLIFDMEPVVTIDKNSENGETFWEKGSSSNDPSFVATAAGGFWFLDLLKVRTRLKDEYEEDLIELQEQLQTLQDQKQAYEDELNGDPAPTNERKTQLQSLITSIENQITSVENQIDAKKDAIAECGDDYDSNPVMFRTPRNILNKVYKLDAHNAQTIDPIEGTQNIKSVTPIDEGNGAWDSCNVEIVRHDTELNTDVTETKECGILVDPGIRSWIGLDVKCNYWGVFVNGIAGYSFDETIENGLGRCAGTNRVYSHSPGDNPFDWVDGSIYEAGYICSPWGDGAWGRFEVLVEFNGKPAKKIATRVTYYEQLYDLAPSELQTRLMADMLVEDDVENGFHDGKVYYSDEIIDEVRIRIRLVNYATDVFMIGFKTLSIDHPWWWNCPGYDPGYLAGNNCEAMGCGNLTCTSLMFGGDHKLYPAQESIPLTRQLIWEGEATYTIKDSDNPYLQDGLQVGYFMDCYFNFDLMAPMTAYRVDISEDTYKPGETTGL